MPLDDALYRSQSDSITLEIIVAVQSLEDSEQLLDLTIVETNSVVAHKIGLIAVVFCYPEFYGGQFSSGAELPGVSDQVLQDNAQQNRVTLGIGMLGNVEGTGPFRVSHPQFHRNR